jgi:acyl-CoA thioester hydrolase
MEHMNVRFYLARAMQGLAGAAAALGMPHAFSPNSAASLLVRGHHVRFLREVRVGAALHMTTGVLSMGESDASLLQTLVDSRSGETAATFVTRVSHVAAREGRPFPWPQRAHEAAAALTVALPADAGARGVAEAGPAAAEVAEAGGFSLVARGAVAVEDCDVFGRVRTEMLLSRTAEGIPHLIDAVRLAAQETLGPGRRIGGAALEYRLNYFGAPGPGDLLEVRSGLTEIGPKTYRARHWLVDPLSGAAWAAAENLSIHFDLETRKAVALAPETVARLQRELTAP